MLNREQKDLIVNNIKDKIQKSQGIFLTNLIGLESNTAVALRKVIRESDGTIIVTKNTLFKRASVGTPAEKLLSNLKGPHAVAFAYTNPPAVAKAIHELSKDKECVSLEAGVLDGKDLGAKDVVALAQLPSREQMLATTLATFMAPISSFVRLLDAIRTKKEEEGN